MPDHAITHPDHTLTWDTHGSGSFREPDGSTGQWNDQGERSWHGADGSVGVWRQDGSMDYTEPLHGIRLTVLGDGSGHLHAKDGSHASWDPEGKGEWTTPHDTRGWFQADGSGGIHHPDGSVELWNDYREALFITPDGVEFLPSSYDMGTFPGPDHDIRESFTPTGAESHSDAQGDRMRYAADGSGSWLGKTGEELIWDGADIHTLRTPDHALATLETDGLIIWQHHRVRFWMDRTGLGGWSMADGSRGAHGGDGSCLYETGTGSGGWRDGSGYSGWWDDQGNRGGRDPVGATWSLNADGSGTFADAILSSRWDATGHGVWTQQRGPVTGTWEPDHQKGTWVRTDGIRESWQGEASGELSHNRHHCEAWEPTEFTHLSPDGAIGVLQTNGSGSWSDIHGTLHTWSLDQGHRVTHGDGSFDTLSPDGAYEYHHAADSVRLPPENGARIWTPPPIDTLAETDPLPIRAALIRAVTQARHAVIQGRMRSARIRHRLEQFRAGPPRRSLAAEPEPVHSRASMALAQADARMQMARIRLQQIAALIRIRRMEHRMRRPQPRIATGGQSAPRPDRG
ncbi:MAG: hypothetical protein HQL98_04700 [Magnetococcales bacterium]|nr:hypothetical protein [Magnetococcales bacterium]